VSNGSTDKYVDEPMNIDIDGPKIDTTAGANILATAKKM
jgi:hypothetical protein